MNELNIPGLLSTSPTNLKKDDITSPLYSKNHTLSILHKTSSLRYNSIFKTLLRFVTFFNQDQDLIDIVLLNWRLIKQTHYCTEGGYEVESRPENSNSKPRKGIHANVLAKFCTLILTRNRTYDRWNIEILNHSRYDVLLSSTQTYVNILACL